MKHQDISKDPGMIELERMVGAGGKDIWTFVGVRPGETTVELEYIRPWETGVGPVERASYRVVVE